MTTKKLSISIDETIVKSLAARFPDLSDKQAVVETLARLALSEWEAWFSASLRPKTASALSQERIQLIYQEKDLYYGKRVTRGVLFNQFNLSYGEASYLERVFSERDQPALTAQTAQKIINELETQLATWNKDRNKKPDQAFTVEVNKLGQRLLQSIMQAAKEKGLGITTNERVSDIHGYYDYTFSSGDAEVVVKTARELFKVQNL